MHASLKDIRVSFGSLVAVDNVSLEIAAGGIHAVVGENGAGKSTLMNVLFGLVRPQAGGIEIDGRPCSWASPQDAIASGLGMVHQHFMLQDDMTVLENIVLCAEPVSRFGFVDFAGARRKLAAGFAEHGIAIDLDAIVGELAVGQRQVVEILKMLYRDARLLILDEPTAVLTPQEKDRLFAILRSFAAGGKSVVIITHKLDEVMEIADHVSVMRGGRLISSGPLGDTSKEQIAREIIGGDLPPARKPQPREPGRRVLAVSGLATTSRSGPVGPVSFEVRAGEVVGIAGVSGNGQAELIQALTGLRKATAGAVALEDRDILALDVAGRRHAGISYIPEDRQRMGLALGATVSENANAGREDRAGFAAGPFLRRRAMADFARGLIERYRIRAGGPAARASTLSGGNKQKLVVGRELARKAPLIIAENPTWGVDIGAIDFIHGELMRMRDEGHAVLLVSTELDEVMALSDRILVMFEGRIAGEVAGPDATRKELGRLMTSRTGGTAEAA